MIIPVSLVSVAKGLVEILRDGYELSSHKREARLI